MGNSEDQNAKREYLKLLLAKSDESFSAFSGTFRSFYLFTLIFLIFSWFRTSELSLFGAKVDIPQEWIAVIAPLVLSFLYFRLSSLYLAQVEYERLVERFIPEAIQGSEWKPNKNDIHNILASPSWVLHPSTVSRDSVIVNFINLIIILSLIIATAIIPVVVIAYFNWLLWTTQNSQIALVISLLSGAVILPGIILSRISFK